MGLLSSLSMMDYVILLGSLLALTYLYVTWTFSHWKKRGVPFVKKPVPLLGNMTNILFNKKPMGVIYEEFYGQLKEYKFGGYFNFRNPELMICDPELIKTMMTKDFASFHDNNIDVPVEVDPMFGRNPFSLRGDRWKTVRSQLTPAFTPGKIKPLFLLMDEVCKGLVDYVTREKDSTTDGIEAKELASKFTTDNVATCAYGLHGNSFTDPNAKFREMGKNIMSTDSWKRRIEFLIMMVAPKAVKYLKIRFFNEEVTNFFRNLVKDTMTHREKNNIKRNDFLQLLMQLKSKGQIESSKTDGQVHEKFTDEDVAAQALTFFTDGFETSATALSFALFELAVNKDVQKRLKDELDGLLKKHGGTLNYEMLQEASYMDMVLSETLRKYPPAPFLTRLCTRPYDLETPNGGVCHVPVNTVVAFPIQGLHHDPKYYPDPDKFDPERFSEENKSTRPAYSYMPFGGGPRLCIGNRFATTQVKAGIAALVTNFELDLHQRTTVPLEFDANFFLLQSKDGIWINFKKYSK